MEEIIYPENVTKSLFFFIEKNIDTIENTFHISIALRGNKIMFDGPATNKRNFKKYFSTIIKVNKNNGQLNENDLKLSLTLANDGSLDLIESELKKSLSIKINGKEVYPKSLNQREYLESIHNNDLVFSIGPAGTGKTFLAIAMALNYLVSKRMERIVLTRPVVEAGEKLGFLPGDIQQKVNPYFRPLYDALYYLIGFEKTSDLIDKGIIEIAPLAYMRGRTINNAFIILDEGQNTSNSQMKMFLTRFGQNSKVIVTADLSQIDLPDPKKSGIFKAVKILKKVHGIRVIKLSAKDVVRHSLVQQIIQAYQKDSEKHKDEI